MVLNYVCITHPTFWCFLIYLVGVFWCLFTNSYLGLAGLILFFEDFASIIDNVMFLKMYSIMKSLWSMLPLIVNDHRWRNPKDREITMIIDDQRSHWSMMLHRWSNIFLESWHDHLWCIIDDRFHFLQAKNRPYLWFQFWPFACSDD